MNGLEIGELNSNKRTMKWLQLSIILILVIQFRSIWGGIFHRWNIPTTVLLTNISVPSHSEQMVSSGVYVHVKYKIRSSQNLFGFNGDINRKKTRAKYYAPFPTQYLSTCS